MQDHISHGLVISQGVAGTSFISTKFAVVDNELHPISQMRIRIVTPSSIARLQRITEQDKASSTRIYMDKGWMSIHQTYRTKMPSTVPNSKPFRS